MEQLGSGACIAGARFCVRARARGTRRRQIGISILTADQAALRDGGAVATSVTVNRPATVALQATAGSNRSGPASRSRSGAPDPRRQPPR